MGLKKFWTDVFDDVQSSSTEKLAVVPEKFVIYEMPADLHKGIPTEGQWITR